MRKVKNSPATYLKRSQLRPACVVVERVTEVPKKRTATDFANAVIDSNFYVSFRPDPKDEQQK